MNSSNNLNVHCSETGSVGFNDMYHFEHFLNYLYRTDKAQKNTNNLTENCFAAVVEENDILILPFGDLQTRLSERKKARQFFGKLTEVISGKKISPYDFFINKIIYISFLDDNENDMKNTLSKEYIQEIFKVVISKVHGEENCLYVAHLDQEGDYHIHIVLLKS